MYLLFPPLRQGLCNSNWPGTHCLVEDSLELLTPAPYPHLSDASIRGVHPHSSVLVLRVEPRILCILRKQPGTHVLKMEGKQDFTDG